MIQPPTADLITRPCITRGQPLSEREWQTYFDEEGRIANAQEIRSKIFSGVKYFQLKIRKVLILFLFIY